MPTAIASPGSPRLAPRPTYDRTRRIGRRTSARYARRVTRVDAIIFHPAPASAGSLTAALASIRRWNADRQAVGFERAGARARVVESGEDDRPFGQRVREALDGSRSDGAVLLGSGSIPLATAADRRAFVATAAGPAGHALANNRY